MPFHVDIDVAGNPRRLKALLEGLVMLNLETMAEADARGIPLPPLYDAGVKYERERGTEHWQPADELVKSGAGDCEDLSCYRVAELRRLGESSAFVDVVPAQRRGSYHAIVRRATGEVEDPSVILINRSKNMYPTVIDVRDDGSCVVGEVDVPTEDGPITVTSRGANGADALNAAADAAQSIMDDPTIAPFVPPQARIAVAGARLLAKAAGSGVLSSIFGRLKGNNKRSLARKLLDTTDGWSRGGSPTVHLSGLELGGGGGIVVSHGGGPGSGTTVRDHRRPRPKTRPRAPAPSYDPYANPYGGYPQDPYAMPPYYGGMPPYYGGGIPYGGYPPMDPYGGYGPYAPVDPWSQYQSYGWGPASSPWAGDWSTALAEQYGSAALDAIWPTLQAQSAGGGW